MISPVSSALEPLEARIAPATISISAAALVFTAGTGLDNFTVIEFDSATHLYTITESSESIVLDAQAMALGFTVSADGFTATGPEGGIRSLTFHLGDGSDGIVLVSASATASLMLKGGDGDDYFEIDEANFAGVANAPLVSIDGGPGSDSVQISDASDTAGATYHLTNETVTRENGLGADVSNSEFLSILAGTGPDAFNLLSVKTGTQLEIFGNSGNDLFNIGGAARTFAQIKGPVFLRGDSGADRFVFDESSNAASGGARLTATAFTSDLTNVIAYNAQPGDRVAVSLRSFPDSPLQITGLAGGVEYTIEAGANGTQFLLGGSGQRLERILGHATIHGGGNSTATIDDRAATGGGEYRINASEFHLGTKAMATFTGLTALTLKTGAGADKIDTAGSLLPLDLDSGDGDDQLRVTRHTASVETGDGADSLTITGLAGNATVTSAGIAGSAFETGLVFPFTVPEIIRLSGDAARNVFHVGPIHSFVAIDGAGGPDSISGSDVRFAGKLATFTDAAGNLVTVSTDKGRFGLENFAFRPEGKGATLTELDLTPGVVSFANANIGITAVPGSAGGSGFTIVGRIRADTIDLASVRVRGDLNAITVGDGDLSTPALATFRAHTLGDAGLSALPGGVAPVFDFRGRVGSVLVLTDFARGLLSATGFAQGRIGSLTVGGDFAGHLYATGAIGKITLGSMSDGSSITADFEASIGSLTILHDARSSDIFAGGIIGSVKVGGSLIGSSVLATGRSASVALPLISIAGSVRDSLIGAGYDLSGTAVNPDAAIGTLSIAGNLRTSSIVAGIDATDSFYGNSDDQLATAADGPFSGILRGNPAIFARIARVIVGGAVIGETTPTGASYGIVAERIGTIVIGGFTVLRLADTEAFSLTRFGDVNVRDAG